MSVIGIPSSLKDSLTSSWDHREGERENERMRVSFYIVLKFQGID